MPKITRLSADLANQIAAGEVVERPASVVKELVENAIDAGARRLAIHIELGGKQEIRVEDDGEGMDPEDARLALERHATSKIRSAGDLAAIRTFGFRGEALPSIASVSQFSLRTRARGHASGTEVRVSGGALISVAEVPAREGTTVRVEDLFYNLPARRKFLKSDAAESAQVSRLVAQLALAYPEVGFVLTSGPRALLECPPAPSLRDRLYQLHGERPDLLEIRRDAGGLRVFGYAAALADHGPARGAQSVFVNRRLVKDRTIAHAILDAYSAASIRERSPEVHLFIEMPPEAVDVNVHPTKAEVRFREPSLVHEVVRRALLDALGRGPAPELQLRPAAAIREPSVMAIPGILGAGVYPSRWAARGGDGGALAAAAGRSGPADAAAAAGSPGADNASGPSVEAARSHPDGGRGAGLRPMIPLGQFRDTFIIAVDDEGIAIVDQHVAHERILFERVMQRLAAGDLEAQRLLVPLIVELPPAARQALLVRAADLARLGYELEEFGGAAVRVAAVPALLAVDDGVQALRVLAEDLEGLDRGAGVQDALQRMAATTACHAAVKANDPLTFEKMAHILAELRETAYSTVCPHGRPVMLRLTRREIEKNFERI